MYYIGIDLGGMSAKCAVLVGGTLCGVCRCKTDKNNTPEQTAKDLANLAEEAIKLSGDLQEVNGKIIFEAYNTQDKTAKAVVNKYLGYLSEGVINYVNIFRPRSSDYWRWHKRTGRGYN